MDKDDSYSHILKYTGIFGGVQGINILISLVRSKLVALLLGPDGVGLVSLFNSTIKMVSDTTSLGISMSGVRDISEAYHDGDQRRLDEGIGIVRYWSMLVAALGLLVCVAASPILNKWTFSWGDHTLHFILLSPVVALTAITGGELAVLKGTRMLRQLATISVINVVCALFISVPLYYIWGEQAIVPSLFLLALSQCIVTISYSWRHYPVKSFLKKQFFGRGVSMIRLGIAFTIAGFLGSCADFAIRSFISHSSTLSDLGLFNAGYMLTMVYAGMVFSAMETDYFPRLSVVQGNGKPLSMVVDRQIEISMILVAPMLVALLLALPIVLPLLLSHAFLPALPMTQLLILAVSLRAAKLPVAYIPLAKGDSLSYLLMELIYDVVAAGATIWCYATYGLIGAGVGLLAAAVFDFIMLNVYMGFKYDFRMSCTTWRIIIFHLLIIVGAFAAVRLATGVAYWTIGAACFLLSAFTSLIFLSHHTDILEKARQLLERRRRG